MVVSIEARLLSRTRTTETEPRIDCTNVVTPVQARFPTLYQVRIFVTQRSAIAFPEQWLEIDYLAMQLIHASRIRQYERAL